jgi:hypothetical protein
MNPKQHQALKVAVAVFVFMGVFPPWKEVTDGGQAGYVQQPLAYSFLLSPPKPAHFVSVQLDFGRLFLGWALVGAIGGYALYYFKDEG